jgi:hypothetical protein
MFTSVFLAYMLVYKQPFILQGKICSLRESNEVDVHFRILAAWRLIRSWLPTETQNGVKFVDEKSITQYVSADQLPKDMGGTVTESP